MKLFYKDGEFSKTAVILWLAFGLVAFKYLFGGMEIFGVHIPEFDPDGALAFFGTAASLYFANHNVRIGAAKAVQKLSDPEVEKDRV